MTEKRNHFIDLLRIIAASWVALFHFNEPIAYINNWYRDFCKLGFIGVPIFFVVSGYCILIALHHNSNPYNFAIRRFFRIFPPYWFSVILVIIIIVGEKLITGTNSVPFPKQISDMLATVVLLTSPVTHVPTINWVYWTLPYEVMFYVAIFLIALFKQAYFTIILIIITLLTLFLPQTVNGFLSFFKYWPMFMLGVGVYNLNFNSHKKLSLVLLIITIISLIFGGIGVSYIITSVITAGLIYWNNRRPMQQNILSKYGDISYSLYLIHVPVGIYVLGFLKLKFQTNIIENIVCDLVVLFVCAGLSMLMFKYVEMPAIKYGKQLAIRQ
jgi:peptidoglycan/LPS O-acetylase OafA/YrhL